LYECRKIGIPVICTLDTDCDPSLVDVGVAINDDSAVGVHLFLKELQYGIQEGRRWWLSKKSSQQRQANPEVEKKRTRRFVCHNRERLL
jgi:ribosomal protein S2